MGEQQATASAKYNFYGADRNGEDLFADCLLALDARTGKRLWHFQMVHHEIWDYDDATAPKLLTVRHDGKLVDVVAQVTKQGFVWVFDRVTGSPLWPIEERPVPRSDMPGEQTWPTQPFPVKPPPFARQKFTVDDLSPFLSPEDRARFRDEILSARNEGLFTPPFWLRSGDSKVAAVATRVGYESEAALSRAFKRCFGQSPGAYRRHYAACNNDERTIRTPIEKVPLYPSELHNGAPAHQSGLGVAAAND